MAADWIIRIGHPAVLPDRIDEMDHIRLPSQGAIELKGVIIAPKGPNDDRFRVLEGRRGLNVQLPPGGIPPVSPSLYIPTLLLL